jgi:hypothetical protein
LRIKPQFGQVSENSSKSPRSEPWRVLHFNAKRSYFANDARHLSPESATLSFNSCTFSCCADVGTRETSGDDIDKSAPRLPIKGLDVVPDRKSREDSIGLSLQQHCAPPGINLDSADGNASEQQVSVDSASSAGENVQGSKLSLVRYVHIVHCLFLFPSSYRHSRYSIYRVVMTT